MLLADVIRLDGNGPDGAGLGPLALDPSDFQSPLPVQHVHEFFGDTEVGLSVGVWDTTTMQEVFGPYPGDEFIFVLQGAFAMVDGKGDSVTARAGDCVTFRNGIPTSWKQDGYLRKIYLTLRDPKAETPKIASAKGGVTVLVPPDNASDEVFFRNDTGTMTVRHFTCATLNAPHAVSGCHELVQVLQGQVEVSEPFGAQQVFGAGEAFFIPQGTICGWSATQRFSAWRVSLTVPGARLRTT